jgi:hypothetical protein
MLDTNIPPTVTLGGQVFAVPPLAARQNRVIDPLILNLIPFLASSRGDNALGVTALTTEQYDALQEICYVAITRASPKFTREQFLDLPVSLQEMIVAFPVIAQQTGLFKAASKDQPPGEASAAP